MKIAARKLLQSLLFLLLIFVFTIPARAQDSPVYHGSFLTNHHFRVALAFTESAGLMDFISTEKSVGSTEADPLFCGHNPNCMPSETRFLIQGGAMEFVPAFVSYKMSVSRHALIRHASWTPVILDVAAHIVCTNENLRLHYPQGAIQAGWRR